MENRLDDGLEAHSMSEADLAYWGSVAKDTFWGYLGAELQELGGGRAVVYLDLMPHHLNLVGLLHGGVYATLMDSAMALLAMDAQPDNVVVTTNLTMNFVSPIKEGRLVVTAELVHRSRKMISTQAYARSAQGELCAFGSGTFRVLDQAAKR